MYAWPQLLAGCLGRRLASGLAPHRQSRCHRHPAASPSVWFSYIVTPAGSATSRPLGRQPLAT